MTNQLRWPGARVIEVIETTLELRGCGLEPYRCPNPGCGHEPIRRVTQYWSRAGELLAEHDIYTKEAPAE